MELSYNTFSKYFYKRTHRHNVKILFELYVQAKVCYCSEELFLV